MISGVIFTALRGLVNDRCYPGDFMQPDGGLPEWPAISYETIAADPATTICGNDDGSTDTEIVQIECAAKSFGAMLLLRDQVFAALQNVDPPATRDSWVWRKDTDRKVFVAMIDYSFHPSSV